MYEPYQRKKRVRRQRGSFSAFVLKALLRLLVLALLLAALLGVLLWALPAGLFAVEPAADLALDPSLPASPINVLLLGLDEETEGQQRSDAILLASIGGKTLRLTSILRDTEVDIPGVGKGRLNSAWTRGGADLALRTVNQNFGLNVMHYVAADYACLVDVVDALGGIEVDITEEEMAHINKNVKKSAPIFKPLGYTCDKLTTFGEGTHLNGLQALGFARIRRLDSDFTRAFRQRKVLSAMLAKLKANLWNPILLARVAKAALSSVQTDLSPAALTSLALKAVFSGELATLRLPVEGSYTDTQSVLRLDRPEANRQALRDFLYQQ